MNSVAASVVLAWMKNRDGESKKGGEVESAGCPVEIELRVRYTRYCDSQHFALQVISIRSRVGKRIAIKHL